MKNLITALFLLIAPVAMAQPFKFNQGQADAKTYYEELPYQDVNGKLFITADVNGKTRRFLFDTGALTMISTQLADELQLKNVYHTDVVDVNGGHFTMNVATLDVKLGNTTFTGIPALRGLQGEVFKCWTIDGIIGSNLLRNSLVCFNGATHTIIITNQKDKLTLNSKNSGKLNTNTDAQSTPIMEIQTGEKATMNLEFDSGDSKIFRFTDDLVKQMNKPNAYQVAEQGYGASTMGAMGMQQAAGKQRLLFPWIMVGGQHFNNALTETNATGIPGMGTDLLKYGILTLDYVHQKYYFDPVTPSVNLDTTGWPLSLTIQNNHLVIGVVWDIAKDLVKPGEQVLAVDGADYTQIDLCDLVNKRPVLEGKQTALLIIKNTDGSTRQLTIKKQDYSASTAVSH